MDENTDSYKNGKCLSGPPSHVLPISSYQMVYHPSCASLQTILTAGAVSPWYLLGCFSLLASTVSLSGRFWKDIRVNMSHTVVVIFNTQPEVFLKVLLCG